MTPATASPARKVAYVLATIDGLGIVGLFWLMMPVLFFDGFMVIEFSIWAAATAALIAVTAGGLFFLRRGPLWAALTLLAIGAVPTGLVLGGIAYLDFNPIDWK